MLSAANEIEKIDVLNRTVNVLRCVVIWRLLIISTKINILNEREQKNL